MRIIRHTKKYMIIKLTEGINIGFNRPPKCISTSCDALLVWLEPISSTLSSFLSSKAVWWCDFVWLWIIFLWLLAVELHEIIIPSMIISKFTCWTTGTLIHYHISIFCSNFIITSLGKEIRMHNHLFCKKRFTIPCSNL